MNVGPPKVPDDIEDGSVRKYLKQLNVFLVRSMGGGQGPFGDTFAHRSRSRAVSSVLLVSPNGSVYTVTVGDDGTLETDLVAGA